MTTSKRSLQSDGMVIEPKRNTAELIEKQIERYFMQRILSGEMPAGTRLPSNQALAATWSTSCSTVQRALANLTATGLLERATSRGTFVRSQQNRALIGILVGPNLVDEVSWFYRAFCEAISNEIDSDFFSTRIYAGLSLSQPKARVRAQVKHLTIDRKYFSFAGFIEISTAQMSPKIRPVNYPRVTYSSLDTKADIRMDKEDYAHKVLDSLHQQGIRHFYLVETLFPMIPGMMKRETSSNAILNMMSKFPGMSVEKIRIEFDSLSSSVQECVHSHMMKFLSGLNRRSLPKAIVVSDDVASIAVVLAFLKQGIRIPEDIQLYVKTGENTKVFYSVPVHCYVEPTRKLAQAAAQLLRRRIAGDDSSKTPISLKGWMETC